jgi:hypothetical protein
LVDSRLRLPSGRLRLHLLGRFAVVSCHAGSVDAVRRVGVLTMLIVLTLGGWSPRADAHVCPSAVKVPVGRSATVPVYVTVESERTPDIEVDVPAALRLENVAAPTGWKFTREGQALRFRGPAFAPFTCPSFTISVTAPAKGAFPISVVQRNAHGDVTARSTADPGQPLNPGSSPTVYAGVKPPSPPGGSGPSSTTIAGIVLVAVGVVAAIALGLRTRRSRREDEREDELEDRLEEFRKQARDRSERSQS